MMQGSILCNNVKRVVFKFKGLAIHYLKLCPSFQSFLDRVLPAILYAFRRNIDANGIRSGLRHEQGVFTITTAVIKCSRAGTSLTQPILQILLTLSRYRIELHVREILLEGFLISHQ